MRVRPVPSIILFTDKGQTIAENQTYCGIFLIPLKRWKLHCFTHWSVIPSPKAPGDGMGDGTPADTLSTVLTTDSMPTGVPSIHILPACLGQWQAGGYLAMENVRNVRRKHAAHSRQDPHNLNSVCKAYRVP